MPHLPPKKRRRRVRQKSVPKPLPLREGARGKRRSATQLLGRAKVVDSPPVETAAYLSMNKNATANATRAYVIGRSAHSNTRIRSPLPLHSVVGEDAVRKGHPDLHHVRLVLLLVPQDLLRVPHHAQARVGQTLRLVENDSATSFRKDNARTAARATLSTK